MSLILDGITTLLFMSFQRGVGTNSSLSNTCPSKVTFTPSISVGGSPLSSKSLSSPNTFLF